MKSFFSFLIALAITAMGLFQPAMSQTTSEIAKGNTKHCADVCQKTLDYCVKKGGKHAEASVTNSLKDCIQACKSAFDFLNRGSAGLQGKSCALAVQACNECAKTMDAFSGDNTMLACANECRKTVGNCEKLVK
ncbi:hypothetical protein KA183_06075 [bacterium]|nr:hypothetical protein [bacterium]